MFFAANNISTAEENSAAANSLRTKQHLSGLKFLRLFFGIKIILFFFILTFLFITELKAKNCLTFLPYGFNDYYVHLPQDASFCVKEGKDFISYKTDDYGGRLISNEIFSEEIQVFGDSQVLGFDVEKIDKHYLQQLYKNNFIIYAAPNNGPYEVINFLIENKKIIKKKVVITFNYSVDIFRISNEWDPKGFVALKHYELDEILESPLKYKWIIFKSILFKRHFTLRRFNNEKMKNLFSNTSKDKIYSDTINYLDQLDKLAKKLNIKIDFIITQPYWLYSKNRKKLILDKKFKDEVENLICNSFKKTKNINNIYVSNLKNQITKNSLTYDERHFKSDKIDLIRLEKICGAY